MGVHQNQREPLVLVDPHPLIPPHKGEGSG
jgi:hypothetical protein